MAKLDSFEIYLEMNKPACVMLLETWLKSEVPDSILGFSNYSIFRSDRNGTGGGVCILLSKHYFEQLNVSILERDVPNIETIFLKLCNSRFSIILGCVYRPPKTLYSDDVHLVNVFRL